MSKGEEQVAGENSSSRASPRSARSVVANYTSMAAKLASHVLLVPLYVSQLGQEKFGVIGFFMTLQSVLLVFDFGLGVSINRELARKSALNVSDGSPATLVRSVELISWVSGGLLGLSVWLLAPAIATRWLTASQLSTSELEASIRWMGIALAAQWPIGIYNGGLQGIQQQETMVKITIAGNLGFALGAVALLSWRPTLDVFFGWRVLVSLASVMWSRFALLRHLPSVRGKRFDWVSTAEVRRFSGGMSAVALTGVALAQLDKVLASRFLSLTTVGAYMVAGTAASLIPQLVTPVFSVYFPQLSQSFARQDEETSIALFRRETRLILLVVCPAALTLAFFAGPLLAMWTHDREVTQTAAPILATLAMGSALNSIMVPIYSVQLAAGWTKIAVQSNLLLLATMAPTGIVLAWNFGEQGASLTWVAINAVYVGLGCVWTIGRFAKGTTRVWLVEDVLRPFFLAALATACAKAASLWTTSLLVQILFAVAGGIAALAGVLALYSDLRTAFIQYVARRMKSRN